MKRIFITLVLFLGFIVPTDLFAQTEQKIYTYDAIDTRIAVMADSTFAIEERQLFNYQSGTFHQGLRSIPLNKVSRISDVLVVNGANGQALQYSPRRLDKNDPDDWGKYTYYIQGGNLNIEWYYNLSNTTHQWVLRYVVHGGLEFYTENDRLYWNIFSGYDVPVKDAAVRVTFPQGTDLSQLKFAAYRTASQPIGSHIQPSEWVDFQTFNVAPMEAFTIDIAFPKGVVQESAFWKDWAIANYGYLGSVVIVLLGIIFLIAYWYYTERYNKGRGVVIAQYEPPRQLRPAMAEVLLKETITEKAWPATIVDLAVRGYVSIEDEVRRKIPILGYLFSPKGYVIKKKKEFAGDMSLEEYERDFLDMIFSMGDRFSLVEIKRDVARQRVLGKGFIKLKEKLYGETDQDTYAFEKGVSKSKYFTLIVGVTFFLVVYFGGVGINYMGAQLNALAVTCGATIIFIGAFILFEPRLSKEGYLLKEDWLGFKLYLETAERYRMQNLTPDIFEKYLPYAMIFGIEKKWAQAFEGMTMQPPSWYGSTYVGGSIGGGVGASFSPVTFSSSFSTSFASAFASSSGSSGGGGGGSAGGGGGGGGGGAS